MRRRVQAKVFGKVQGVLYRDFARKNAVRLDIVGTVRNRADGSVLVVAEGEEEALADYLRALEKDHPWATVEKIEADWSEDGRAFSDFRILRS